MLARQDEITASKTQVEIRIAPGVKIGATSESKTGFVGGVLASVVDEDDGHAESSGEFPQDREHGGDLGGVILVDALKSDVGVQDEKLGSMACEGISKPVEMLVTRVRPRRSEANVSTAEI